jgi:Uma2 family endonuclease
MAVQLMEQTPASPASTIGPYRLADYLNTADEPRLELLYGRFFASPSPSLLHQALVALIWNRLHAIAKRSGGRAYLAPLDVALADHSVVQPDVVYVAPERLSILGKRIEGAPNLVVEVLSSGTARRDRGDKLKLYAESSVEEYWLVDAEARQIEFLSNRSGELVVILPEDGVYRSPRLPEIHLDLEELWAEAAAELP